MKHISIAKKPDRALRHVPIKRTIQQIKDGSVVDTDLPVSRRIEAQVHGHSGWERYWESDSSGTESTIKLLNSVIQARNCRQ